MTALKAIFFDLDNVLVFTESTHTHAWHIALREFDADPTQIDFTCMIGMSDMEQARLFREQFNIPIEAKSLWELKRKIFLRLTENGFDSAFGRDALLKKISKSHTVGVVSSSSQKVINRILALEKIAPYFHFIVGFEDSDKHKPDPAPYQHALNLAGVLPHEALVVEDSITGIMAAQRAGIPVIGLQKDQTPDQLLDNIKYYPNFEEIAHELFD